MIQPLVVAIGAAFTLVVFWRHLHAGNTPPAPAPEWSGCADALPLVMADLGHLLESVLAHGLRDESNVWQASLPHEPLAVAVHPSEIEELLRHLLALPGAGACTGGSCQVMARVDGAHAALHFMDRNGSAQGSRLAEAFGRRSVDAVAGQVARCRQIVQRHAGRIYPAPSPLGGLGLTVRLPLRAQ
jgi:hypothetical protein